MLTETAETASHTTREHTLYAVLAEPAPPGAPRGETIFTATKETVDRDQEDDDGTTIHLQGPLRRLRS